MVFFIFNQTDSDALRATGVGAHGNGSWEYHAINGVLVGALHNAQPWDRPIVDAMHPDLMCMPGVNGNLSAKHAQHLAKGFPKTKEGDAFRTVLSQVYASSQHETFNPDNY